MNKQEAIKRVEQMGEYERFVDEPVSKSSVLNIISQIHEPKKVAVPKYVADWYEENKDNFEDGVYELFVKFYEDRRELDTELYQWFKLDGNKQIETLVKMKLFGYEVEKEKLYTVEIPNPNGDGYGRVYLGRNEDNKIELRTWNCFSSIEFSNDWKQFDNAQLTEDEIKKDYKWAWQFAKEVEQ